MAASARSGTRLAIPPRRWPGGAGAPTAAARGSRGLRRGHPRRPADQGEQVVVAGATIDGIYTRYEVYGSGPPVLMFSPGGFDGTVDKWTAQGIYAQIRPIEHLSKRVTCIAFDRRECGASGGRLEAVSWTHYVAQAKGLLDHLHIGRAHIMGACMGCSPALAFAVA